MTFLYEYLMFLGQVITLVIGFIVVAFFWRHWATVPNLAVKDTCKFKSSTSKFATYAFRWKVIC